MIIDCIADLHGHYPELDGGDLLIVAGDLTARSTLLEHAKFIDWLCDQRYKKIVFIAGNHDEILTDYTALNTRLVSYLCDSGTEFEGIKIWGMPWTLTFPYINPKCTAFTCTEDEIKEKIALIPDDTDILITHGPMFGCLDRVTSGTRVGSTSLTAWKYAHSKTLKVHVCGHIHESYGILDERKRNKEINDRLISPIENVTVHVNCSHVNERYEPVNKPIRVIL